VRVGCLSLGKIGVKIGNTSSRVSINSWESACWYTIPTGPDCSRCEWIEARISMPLEYFHVLRQRGLIYSRSRFDPSCLSVHLFLLLRLHLPATSGRSSLGA